MKLGRLLRGAVVLAGLALPAVAPPAAAHESGAYQVKAHFEHDGTYRLEVAFTLEQILGAPLPPLPPSAPLAGLPSGLGEPYASFLAHFIDGVDIAFDGRAVHPDRSGAPTARHRVTGDLGGPGRLQLTFSGPIPGGAQAFTFASRLPLGAFSLAAKNATDAATDVQFVESGRPSRAFFLDETLVPPTRLAVMGRYVVLGFQHILPKGLDHILFVLGLFLLSLELRPLLWQVSAFTLAHTLTLGLSIYGVVSLPSRLVETLIAASIVYVAVENVLSPKLRPWRVALVFAFGLLHGMGFAGVLIDLGLPKGELLTALLSFNAGVELGQLTVIAAAFAALALPFRQRRWYRQAVVVPASLAIAATGLFWAIQRSLF